MSSFVSARARPSSSAIRALSFKTTIGGALCLAVITCATSCGTAQPAEALAENAPRILAEYTLTGDVTPVRDPSLIRQGNTFYLFSTDDGASLDGAIKIRCSSDLKAWSLCGQVFNSIPAWITQQIPGVMGLWAPDISFFNGLYHLYYAASIFGTNRSLIALATNPTLDPSDPNYSWTDRGEVLSSRSGNDYNAIDPNILVDGDGKVWLTFGSFWSGIKQAPVDPSTGLLASNTPEPYSLAARPTDPAHAVEGAFVVQHGGYYYLFVSFGLCCTIDPLRSDYHIMVGRGRSVHGPFTDKNGAPMLSGGGTMLLAGSTQSWNAPGGESLLTDPETGDTTIVFHAHRLPNGTPYLFADQLTWNNGWPQIVP
jgi:arabinan endo-1,5-alpha-L-arabinosidase